MRNRAESPEDSLDVVHNPLPEEAELPKQVSEGNLSAMEANLRLLTAIAKRYSGGGLDMTDLIQTEYANRGHTADEFVWSKSYANWWVRQVVVRAIANQPRTVRVPVHMVEDMDKTARCNIKQAQEENDTFAAEKPNGAVDNAQLAEALEKIFKTLTEREMEVLRLRCGVYDGHSCTLEEVAEKFGVSRERIRQIESSALRKLHRSNRGKPIREVKF